MKKKNFEEQVFINDNILRYYVEVAKTFLLKHNVNCVTSNYICANYHYSTLTAKKWRKVETTTCGSSRAYPSYNEPGYKLSCAWNGTEA